MIYEVTGYVGTGLDAVNIPEDSDFFDTYFSANARTYDAVDLVQPFGLTSVRIRAVLAEVEDLDFLKIDSEWYACGVPVMISEDVAEIPIEHQGILSIGGIKNVVPMDGFIVRRYVPPGEQQGYAALDDPFLAPADVQDVQASGVLFDDTGSEFYTVMAATVDLASLGAAAIAGTLKSDVYGEGEARIAVPHIPQNDANGKSIFSYRVKQGDADVLVINKPAPGMGYFRGTAPVIQAGVVASKQCGVTDSILAQYILPAVFSGAGTTLRESIATDNYGTVAGVYKTEAAEFEVNQIAAAQPILALNRHNTLTLCAIGSGNSVTYPGYKLAKPNQLNRVLGVICVSDARQEGRPYFRFSWIQDEPYNVMGLVGGAQWLNAPLVYYGSKDGSLLASMKTDAAISSIDRNAPYDAAKSVLSAGSRILNATVGLAGPASSYNSAYSVGEGMSYARLAGMGYSGDYAAAGYAMDVQAGAMQAGASGVGGAVLGLADTALSAAQNAMQRGIRKKELLQNLALDYFVAAPRIAFPDFEGLRDYVSNGCIIIKTGYSQRDLTRLNRVLNMYGCYVGREPFKSADVFSSREDFNYVETTGATIGGAYPRWRREEIENELNGGIRIWHVKPDTSLYDEIPPQD